MRKDVVQLPNGQVFDDYYIWEGSDVVLIIPEYKDGKYILVEQYKHGAGVEIIEFPAGYVEEGENKEEAVKRELYEEVGGRVKFIECLGKFSSRPANRSGYIYIYYVKLLERLERQSLDEKEDISLLELSLSEIVEMVMEGEIYASDTVAALSLYMAKNGLMEIR